MELVEFAKHYDVLQPFRTALVDALTEYNNFSFDGYREIATLETDDEYMISCSIKGINPSEVKVKLILQDFDDDYSDVTETFVLDAIDIEQLIDVIDIQDLVKRKRQKDMRRI